MSSDRPSDWEFAIFRPRMGGRARGAPLARDLPLRRAVLMRMARGFGGAGRSPTSLSAIRGRWEIRLPPRARRCVVKAHYVALKGHGARAARAHLAYIERDGVERDGSPGQMFGPDGNVRRQDFAAPIEGEQRQFRFIIGPEDGDDLDLRAFTRTLMGRMERDLGRELKWAAVCHYDTDNPHVHVVVRGVDTRDRDVRIDPTYLSEGLRLRARELATQELGPRSELSMTRQLDREVSEERVTTLDRQIARLAPEGTVRLADIAQAADAHQVSRAHVMQRLETLEKMHLAERVSVSSWRLESGWHQTLRGLGERNDIIKEMHKALCQPGLTPRIYEPGMGPVEGVVRHKGLHDEKAGAPYVIVQTSRREACYVKIDRFENDHVRVGERVRLAAVPGKWVTAPDLAITREAAAHGGIYNPMAHQRRLAVNPVVVNGQRVPAETVVAVNVRRLEHLARYNLVTPTPDGNWKIPPNLIERLREREKASPGLRIQVESLDRSVQVVRDRPRGPALDR